MRQIGGGDGKLVCCSLELSRVSNMHRILEGETDQEKKIELLKSLGWAE